MLSCLLIAALLGGVATANPGGAPDENASETAQAQHAAEAAGEGGATPGEHTAGDCDAAIEGVDLPSEDEATGLPNAIYVVAGNCARNLAAPGLLVALDRLTRNLERHETHQAEMAAKGGAHGNAGSAPGHSGELPGQGSAHAATSNS